MKQPNINTLKCIKVGHKDLKKKKQGGFKHFYTIYFKLIQKLMGFPVREIKKVLFLTRCAWLSERRVVPSVTLKAKHELISRARPERKKERFRERERNGGFGPGRPTGKKAIELDHKQVANTDWFLRERKKQKHYNSFNSMTPSNPFVVMFKMIGLVGHGLISSSKRKSFFLCSVPKEGGILLKSCFNLNPQISQNFEENRNGGENIHTV